MPLTSPSDAPEGRGLVGFFAIALGFTFTLQLPAVLARAGVLEGPVERFMAPAGLGAFGPLVAAIVMSARRAGGLGTRALCSRLRPVRGVGAGWYVAALLRFAVLHVGGVAVGRLFGVDAGRWLYPPETAAHVAGLVMMPLLEEPGWRGFAMPRLASRLGPLRGSLVLGALWELWHTMMFVLQGMSAAMFALAFVNIGCGSVVFGWLYQRTRGSLLIAWIAHVGIHLDNPTHAMPAVTTPFVVWTAAIAVAAAVAALDRAAWMRPANASPGQIQSDPSP